MTIPAYRMTPRGEYRHASDEVVFEAVFDEPDDVHPGLYDGDTAGGGTVTHDATACEAVLGVSTGGTDAAVLRTHCRPRAGSLGTRITRIVARCDGLVTGQVKQWGIGDDSDGFFFQLSGETFSIVRRTNVSGTPDDSAIYNRGQWNIDSTTVVDPEKTHVWEVREAATNGDIEFCVDGIVMHKISTDGSIQGPACARTRLPLLLRCANTAATAAGGSLKVAAASISITHAPIANNDFSVQSRDATVGTIATALAMIRPKATFGSVENRGELTAKFLSVYTSAECVVELVTGSSPASAPTSHGSTSRAESSTAPGALTGGIIRKTWIVNGSLNVDLSEVLRLQADGSTQDTLAVTAKAISGTAVVDVALSWKETP